MSAEAALYRRVLRRGVHASRTLAASIVAVLVVLLLLATVVASIWWVVDPAVRERGQAVAEGVFSRVDPGMTSIVGGALLVMLAVILIALAVSPGRRARRGIARDRLALLVDDGVIADAVADSVARQLSTTRRHIAVTVARRTVTVRITPLSGLAVDTAAAGSACEEVLSRIGLSARARVVVAAEGVIA